MNVGAIREDWLTRRGPRPELLSAPSAPRPVPGHRRNASSSSRSAASSSSVGVAPAWRRMPATGVLQIEQLVCGLAVRIGPRRRSGCLRPQQPAARVLPASAGSTLASPTRTWAVAPAAAGTASAGRRLEGAAWRRRDALHVRCVPTDQHCLPSCCGLAVPGGHEMSLARGNGSRGKAWRAAKRASVRARVRVGVRAGLEGCGPGGERDESSVESLLLSLALSLSPSRDVGAGVGVGVGVGERAGCVRLSVRVGCGGGVHMCVK